MSSNAYPRSRPRARHQRVPRPPTCDHPRFITLVNELSRLEEIKQRKLAALDEFDDNCNPNSSSISDLLTKHQNNCRASNNQHSPLSTHQSRQPCTNAPSHLTLNTSNIAGSTSKEIINNSVNQKAHQSRHQLTTSAHDSSTLAFDQNLNASNTSRAFNSNERVNNGKNISNSSHSNICQYQGYSKASDLDQDRASGRSDTSDNLEPRLGENRSKRKRVTNDSLNTATCLTASNKRATMLACCSTNSKKMKSSLSDSNLSSSSSLHRPLSPSFTKCPICLLDSLDRDPSFTNTCFHLFCYVCIENWTKNKATCPLCRTEFTKIIYNIKSATSYDEKVARPIRRDDDEALYPDRFIIENFRLSRSGEVDVASILHHDFLFQSNFFVNTPLDSLESGLRENLTRSSELMQNQQNLTSVPRSYQSTHFNPLPGYILSFPNRPIHTTGPAINSASSSNDSNNLSVRRFLSNGRFSTDYSHFEGQNITRSINPSSNESAPVLHPAAPTHAPHQTQVISQHFPPHINQPQVPQQHLHHQNPPQLYQNHQPNNHHRQHHQLQSHQHQHQHQNALQHQLQSHQHQSQNSIHLQLQLELQNQHNQNLQHNLQQHSSIPYSQIRNELSDRHRLGSSLDLAQYSQNPRMVHGAQSGSQQYSSRSRSFVQQSSDVGTMFLNNHMPPEF